MSKLRYRIPALALLFTVSSMMISCGKNTKLETQTQTQPETQVQPTLSQTDENMQSAISNEATDYVNVAEYIPNIIIDLKYATTDNFTGQVIYDFNNAYLRYGTVVKLADAEAELESLGYRIKIWDAYRPFFAQEFLWSIYPDPNFVANPANGYKAHNLGGTLDMTITDMDGNEVLMPSAFDDFTSKADRNYNDVDAQAGANSDFLEELMVRHGFSFYSGEWWEYRDTTSYSYTDFTPL